MGDWTGDLNPQRNKTFVPDALTIINKQSEVGKVRCNAYTDTLQVLQKEDYHKKQYL